LKLRLKRTTCMEKLFNAYCHRTKQNLNSCRFIFEGERLKPGDTPDSLGMEDEETVDVMTEQIGGAAYEDFEC